MPTEEPCLFCTCTLASLVCHLRMCPAVPNSVPQGCYKLQKAGQCCPEVVCGELTLKLPLTSLKSALQSDNSSNSYASLSFSPVFIFCISRPILYFCSFHFSYSTISFFFSFLFSLRFFRRFSSIAAFIFFSFVFFFVYSIRFYSTFPYRLFPLPPPSLFTYLLVCTFTCSLLSF